MRLIILITSTILIILFNSCDKEFDVNAEYEDVTILYGLLDPNDSIHYVKVNKSFLGDASAYEMAKESDSLNYKNILVELIPGKIKSDGTFDKEGEVIVLEKTVLPKEEGVFASDSNIIYRTPGNNTILDRTKDYKLNVSFPDKDKENVYAYTSIINSESLKLTEPQLSFQSLNLYKDSKEEFVIYTAENAKMYELKFKFYYYILTNTDTLLDSVSWNLGTKVSESTVGKKELNYTVSGNDFLSKLYTAISNKDSYNPDYKRVVKRCSFAITITTGAEELYTYINVSSPSSSIVMHKVDYTNVSNGLGLLSSRTDRSYYNVQLHKYCIQDIHSSNITRELNFSDYNEFYFVNEVMGSYCN